MRHVKVHKNCGGVIKKDVCTKCGHKFGVTDKLFRDNTEEQDIPELGKTPSQRDYRARIRRRDDIR